MNRATVIIQLALADFRERTRRYSFLVTMLGVLFFAYLVITGKYTIQFGDIRTVYDSAWAGSAMAVCSSIMLTLVGFYLVKGSIERDRRTEVGQIVAATSISKGTYITSKFVSNVATLWLMMAVLAAVAFGMLLYRNESGTIDLYAFLIPFLIIAAPATLFAASVAVLFDSVRWLRSSAGNVIYLFLAEFCIVFGMLNIPLLDLGGVILFTESVRAAAAAAFPGEKISLIMGFIMFDPALQVEEFRVFNWSGIIWTSGDILLRLFWVGVAFAVVGTAVPFFDRFDPARNHRRKARKKKRSKAARTVLAESKASSELAYGQLSMPTPAFKFLSMLTAELRLAIKGRHWFWYAVAIGLCVAQLLAPFNVARMYLTPAAMVWPLIIWSTMGSRDRRHNTDSLLLSSPQPLVRQFPAVWMAGLLVAMAAVGCMLFRAAASGQWSYAAALVVGAFLIPTVSLMLGTLTGSRKLFEVLYLIVWYVGSIDHLSALDLLGTTEEAITGGKFTVLIILTIACLTAAFSSRRVQMLRA